MLPENAGLIAAIAILPLLLCFISMLSQHCLFLFHIKVLNTTAIEITDQRAALQFGESSRHPDSASYTLQLCAIIYCPCDVSCHVQS